MNYLSVVSEWFVDFQGGAPRVAWDICKVMRDRGHDVTLFCRKVDPGDNEVTDYEGIRIVRFELPSTRNLDPLKLRKQIAAGASVARRHLLDTRWDVVHIHLPVDGKRAVEVIGPGPRYIYTVHSPAVVEVDFNWSQQGIQGAIKRLLGRRRILDIEGGLLRRVDRIQTLSKFTKDAIGELYDVADKTTVVPHWCRPDFVRKHSRDEARAKLGWRTDERILFTVRHFGARHGLDIAVRAAAPLLKRHRDVRFVLAGHGPLRPVVEGLAASLGVEHQVEFPGRVSDEVLKLCYEAADLFVLPSRALECFGLIVLEAYAFGLPIVSTDAGALPEIIRPVAPHMIVPAGDAPALEIKLGSYLDGTLEIPDPETIRAYVAGTFSYDAVVPRILKLIEAS